MRSSPRATSTSRPASRDADADARRAGGVEGETATPAITAPPTDALGGSGPTSGGDSLRIVLIGLGALIGGAMVITHGRKTDRKR